MSNPSDMTMWYPSG
ncbi:hypothetical protein ACLKA7_017664, partial [Drosophila subpalustris]